MLFQVIVQMKELQNFTIPDATLNAWAADGMVTNFFDFK